MQLRLDFSEADAVLTIVAKHNAGETISDAEWQTLFATEPYLRLKRREAGMKRTFTDDDFRKFVLSDDLAKRARDLQRAVTAWKHADLQSTGERVLAYLPNDARIRTKIFPVIKPIRNSFVYEVLTDPTVFLYIDPQVTEAQFENTVAHELHHIGYASVAGKTQALLKPLPPNIREAADRMGSFGEGIAMLAAAGGSDVHPHAISKAEDRERWDRDMANFNRDVATLNQFFLDIIAGKLSPVEQQEKAMSFFGVQGPWYTVGYKMAVMVEKRYGRAALIECVTDPRKLLRRYNMAAATYNATHEDKLERWAQELLDLISGREQPEKEPPVVSPPVSKT